ncbi:ABC transporter ATP-binding protein [Synechococcus sp. RSCCF101]|uniref:energy-coupling factor ABC transporter ATP-binding protein n=1 Tax=Synechococcus sp. RSCCF101 TaxID=2511069 RepID=UPI001245CE99|nr:ABC transporter ATP-binding protein [Synechococcus sp. RSCCF101]QEY32217.1 ABC transporter ATP-binding protein [Synechococcus sp. RSCCF101]
MLRFDAVSYTYPAAATPSLVALSAEIRAGLRYALIGQNGCGKTTFFRLANGLYRPSAGTIHWQGSPLRYERAALRRLRQQVGLVFQNPEEQLVAATVEEDLSYGLCNLGCPDAEIADRVQQTLVSFELEDLADRPVHALSLGQKKRLAIADVMILRPSLLLLDEPTAYLDPGQVRNLQRLLEAIHAAGTTVVMATHDLSFAQRNADRVLVMHRGRVITDASPERVFSDPDALVAIGLG